MKPHPILQTDRLLLRPFQRSDAVAVHTLAGDRAIADTTLNIPYPYEREMAEEWIATHQPQFEEGELCIFAVVLRVDARGPAAGELIGAIGLTINGRFEHAELGYWIAKAQWGKGYCTEAAEAVLRCAFTTLGLHRVYAHHLSRNPASGRVMEKLGMRHEGRARGHVKKWDRFEDIEWYGLLRDDWRENGGA